MNDTPTRDLATLPLTEAFEAFTPELEMALPDHIPVDRFKRVVLTAINNSTAQNNLAGADRRSLFNACVRCAQDGLYPDGREAALVVFNTKVRDENGQDYWAKLVQYFPMIGGIRKRMRNTGEVLSANSEVVYENDTFQYALGDNPCINHEPPQFGTERGRPLGAYAVIKLRNGEILRDVMSVQDIEKSRAQSRAKDSLMWKEFWSEGARKTVLRRCAKQAPTGSDLDRLLGRDEEPLNLPPLSEMTKVPTRPELSDYTEPKRTRRSRSHAEEAGAQSEAAGTESSNEDEPSSAAKLYFFADAIGEAREFDDVDDAVAAYEEFLEKARGDHDALTVAWQNGASLLSQLREGGLHETADALNHQYGLLLEEIRGAEVPAATKGHEAAPAGSGEYDVVVPWGDGVPPNTWHMLASERLKKMMRDARPAADFARFRAKNDASLMRLKMEFRSWYNLLSTEIDKGASQAAR